MYRPHLKSSLTTTTLLLLAMVMGSLAVPGPTVAEGTRITPTSLRVAPRNVDISSYLRLSGPQAELDVRPLLAKWRAAGSPAHEPIFDATALSKVAAQAPLLPSAPDAFGSVAPNGGFAHIANPSVQGVVPAASSAQNTPPLAAQTGLSTIMLQSTPARHALGPAQTSPLQNCTQVLADTGNSNPTSTSSAWTFFDPIIYYSTFQYTSAPYAWYLAENELGVNDGPVEDTDMTRDMRLGRNTDGDSLGQAFDVPPDVVTLNGTFNYQYVRGSTVPGDRLYVEIYYANTAGGTTTLGDYIDGLFFDVGLLDDDQWRTFGWTITDENTLVKMRGQRVVLRISTWNNNNGISTKLYLDDITANLCGKASVMGQVTQLGNGAASNANISNALILLTVVSANGSQLLAVTTPRTDGVYTFPGLPALPTTQAYQVIYFNYNLDGSPPDDSRVRVLFGPVSSGAVGASDMVILPPFDISNVVLAQPDPYTKVEAPSDKLVSFTWQSRGLPTGYATEYFQHCIYDSQTVVAGTSTPTPTPITLCTDPLGDGPGEIPTLVWIKAGNQPNGSFPARYPFVYGRRYAWYVKVCTAVVDSNGDGRVDNCAGQVGYSFYEHAVTFVEQVIPPPSEAAQPGGSLPTNAAQRPWTVMIYLGGDNDLSDPLQPWASSSNLRTQFDTLKQIAPQVTNAHIVALGDFYGNTGTEVCYLSDPSGPQCQQLGEQDSSNPTVLSNFIKQGLSYPSAKTMLVIASHGHAIVGINRDDTTATAATMAPNVIVEALKTAGLSDTTRKLDVIFFNACLMATVETAVMMAPFANYMVASADLIWVLPFYDRIFGLLGGTPREVAAGIPDVYNAALDATMPNAYRTLIALDLSKIGAVNTALNGLADALKGTLDANAASQLAELADLRRTVQVYDSSGNELLDQIRDTTGQIRAVEEDAFVDVQHLASLLSGSTFAGPAAGLTSALASGLVIKSLVRSGSDAKQQDRHDYVPVSIGLGFYFPNGESEGDQPTLTSLYLDKANMQDFRNTSRWGTFVRPYVLGIIKQNPGYIATAPGTVGRSGEPVRGQMPIAKPVDPIAWNVYLPSINR